MISQIVDILDVDDLFAKIPGLIGEDNPVKLAAWHALLHASGEPVRIYVVVGAGALSYDPHADVPTPGMISLELQEPKRGTA